MRCKHHGIEHNRRERYTHGFFCRDCQQFFSKDSATYRSSELLAAIWCVLHNLYCASCRAGIPLEDVKQMRDKIGLGKKHSNYEEIIEEATRLMAKYGVDENSATHVLSAG